MQNHNDTMRVLHTIYNNTIAPMDPITVPEITTPLYPHQSTLIQGMLAYRKRMTQGMQLDDHELKSKIGFVGDPSGSGKTLSVLGYLVSDTDYYATTELTHNSSPYFYSQKVTYPQNTVNLIIVPTHLFGHWQDEIKNHTTISYVAIDTKGKLKNDMVQTILSSTFVLTTNKCFRAVQEYATRNHITWNNVCIDEPLFIQMKSSDPKLEFQFLWLITYQWPSLLFRASLKKSPLLFLREPMHVDLEEMLLDNTTEDIRLYPCQYIKQFTEYNHSHRGHLLLRCSNDHVSKSIAVSAPKNTIIQCKSTTTLQTLSSIYLARNTSISATNVPHLFQALNIESHTNADYIASYPKKNEIILRKLEENECGICFETCTYPTMLTCCHHVYCGKCILQNTIIQYRCPMCRAALDVSQMKCLSSFGLNSMQTKKEACINVLRSHPMCVVYISFDKIYYDLLNDMKNAHINAELLTSFSLRKTIKSLKEGDINVLFVSKIELIRGLSLPVSCLLFYHELPFFEQKQALINMTLQPHQKPLEIVHLYSEVQV